MQKHLLMFAKLAVSVALISWVLNGIDFKEVLARIGDARAHWVGFAVLFFMANSGLPGTSGFAPRAGGSSSRA